MHPRPYLFIYFLLRSPFVSAATALRIDTLRAERVAGFGQRERVILAIVTAAITPMLSLTLMLKITAPHHASSRALLIHAALARKSQRCCSRRVLVAVVILQRLWSLTCLAFAASLHFVAASAFPMTIPPCI